MTFKFLKLHRQPTKAAEVSSLAAELSGHPVPRERRVVVLGDSLTVRYGPFLRKALGAKWAVAERGVWGQRSDEIRARLTPPGIDPSLVGAVVILGGMNNLNDPAGVERDLEAMYTQVHAAGARVVAVLLPPFQGSEAKGLEWTPQRQDNLDRINAWIKAQPNVDVWIDLTTKLQDPDPKRPLAMNPALAWKDRLHPNDDGCRAIADEINRVAFAPRPRVASK